jgi:hypothetical protein
VDGRRMAKSFNDVLVEIEMGGGVMELLSDGLQR